MKRYSLNHHLKTRYGEKVYKLALRGGTSCPNRDGTCGTGGCIFCSAGGSGDFASDSIDEAITRLKNKNTGSRYIAYYQNYSVTYTRPEKLIELTREATEREDIAIISLATRPDCLGEDILDVLEKTNRKKPLWVELGLQTSDEKTAEVINRGYGNEVFEKAVRELRKRSIDVIVHVILGLPGESRKEMLETVRYINALDVQGVKFQLMHVLEGTRLCDMYREGKFEVLSLEEYTDILTDCLRELREDIIVHRITGDGPKKILVAPLWSGDKKNVLNTIHRKLGNAGVMLV